jgi:CheY-like chemotaxis protein
MNEKEMKRRVLFVDDHEVLARLSCEILEMQGYEAVSSFSGVDAFKKFQDLRPDAVVTDYQMDGVSGVGLAQQIYRINPTVPVVLITGGSPSHSMQVPNIVKILSKEDLFPTLLETLRDLFAAEYAIDKANVVQPLVDGFSGQLEISPAIVTVCNNVSNILDSIVRNPMDLLSMSPRQFEEFVAGIWEGFGYQVELTARTRDQGRDVIAIRNAEARLRFLIECKRYSPDNKVGIGIVRSLYGVVRDENATKGILATTSTFTKDAKKFIDRHIWELEGYDFQNILNWLKKIRR